MDAPAFEGPGSFDSDDFNRADGPNDFNSSSADGQPGPGQGQSKSSRRRRRKRKGKLPGEITSAAEGGSDSAPAPAAITPMEGESISFAAAATPPRRQHQGPPQPGQQPQPGQGPAGKRWKKKFRDRERRPRTENPGNDFNAAASTYSPQPSSNGFGSSSGGFKRKGKQQGGRRERAGFVGPMDHSYREVNGNFSDPSASTISINGSARRGRHHGDSQPIDHSMPRAIPIPENAQTHIYFFIEDLFITAKIQETARKQGVKIAFLKSDKDALATFMDEDRESDRPALIVFDLNNANAKPLTLIPKLKTKFKRSCSIIGFLSHLQGDLKAKATEAGCDTVMPRAAFSQNLPNLLRRYSVEEEEEVNFNR